MRRLLKGIRPGSKRAVTVIELVMVITIVGVLAAVSSMYIKETIDLWGFMSFRNEVVSQQRMALLTMVREMRQVRDINAIENTSNATRFRFQDINNNTIDYQLTNGSIVRNADILLSSVSNLSFTYYDTNNNVLSPPSFNTTDIRRIAVNLTVQASGRSKNIRTQVFPRNL